MHSDLTRNATRRRIAAPLAIVAALTLGLGAGNALAAPAKPKPKPKPNAMEISITRSVDKASPDLQ